ncbi:MAG: divalent metal cation transporter [Planctomycetota bacterium]
MKRLVSILLWSAISAAFIGPGTVTTAAAAGAGYGLSLLWALLFSTLACLGLQEAAARLTIVTGKPLAQALGEQFSQGRSGRLLPALVIGSVVLGCAAYQAGNILGAVAGAALRCPLEGWIITLATGVLAAALLFSGTTRGVARALGCVVALMGAAFLFCAVDLQPSLPAIFRGSLIPFIPAGSGMLALGLIGTTVVPYNLFLGSGLAQGQTLGSARVGLAVAIPLGGLISMGILVVGTAVEGPFSYDALARALDSRLGAWTATLFAFGLFGAGLSSAITAPLAAALSVRGFFSRNQDCRWDDGSWRYCGVWLGVLLFGLGFGLAGVKPVPVIVLAQALNGVILPLVASFLWIAVNDRRLMGADHLCGGLANSVLGVSVIVTVVLGSSGILRAACSALDLSSPTETILLSVAVIFAVPLFAILVRQVLLCRRA